MSIQKRKTLVINVGNIGFEVSNPKNEIVIAYNLDSDSDESSRKVSLSSISCAQSNNSDDNVSHRDNIQKEQNTSNHEIYPPSL